VLPSRQRPVVAGAEDTAIVAKQDAADLKSSTSRQLRDGDGDGHEGVVFEGGTRRQRFHTRHPIIVVSLLSSLLSS
jgi:hypothetical protein